MSKEHIWPQWLRVWADDAGESTTSWTSGFTIVGPGQVRESELKQWTRQGSPTTAKVREICIGCNTGWMSRLEQRARPIIEQLLVDHNAFGETAIAPDNALTLATWALKSAWMRELATPGEPTPTQAMRDHLRRALEPPPGSLVYAARHVGQLNFHARQATAEVTHRDHPWEAGYPPRRVLLSALTFAGLSIVTVSADGEGVPRRRYDPLQWAPVWPSGEHVPWPPAEKVDDRDIETITTYLGDWLRIP